VRTNMHAGVRGRRTDTYRTNQWSVHIVGHVSFADIETCTPAHTARQNRSAVHYSNKLNPVGLLAQQSLVCIAGVCMLDGGFNACIRLLVGPGATKPRGNDAPASKKF
jgi:hypothetical protein